MKKEQNIAWQGWLESKECLEIICGCAAIIRRNIKNGKWPDIENLLTRTHERESLDIIKGHIWLFLCELNNCTQKSQWLQKINENNLSALKTNIVNKYRQTIQDKQRNKNNSPWHACYRRARVVFDKHPDIRLLSEQTGSFYSPQNEPESMPKLSRLPSEIWRPLPAPEAYGNKIRETEIMSEVGLKFWDGLTEILQEKYHLALRIFINFLAHYYPEECCDQKTVSSDAAPSKEENSEHNAYLHPKTAIPADTPPPEYFQTRINLEKLASDLAGQMDEKEKTALVCLYARKMTKTKTAELLGYAHAAGLNYLLKGVHNKMRRFCSLWPGLGAETEDNTLRTEFMDNVIQICRKDIGDRNEHSEQGTT